MNGACGRRFSLCAASAVVPGGGARSGHRFDHCYVLIG
jgi:hypothetical protein